MALSLGRHRRLGKYETIGRHTVRDYVGWIGDYVGDIGVTQNAIGIGNHMYRNYTGRNGITYESK